MLDPGYIRILTLFSITILVYSSEYQHEIEIRPTKCTQTIQFSSFQLLHKASLFFLLNLLGFQILQILRRNTLKSSEAEELWSGILKLVQLQQKHETKFTTILHQLDKLEISLTAVQKYQERLSEELENYYSMLNSLRDTFEEKHTRQVNAVRLLGRQIFNGRKQQPKT